jgi:2-oxoisovalerate dehydrogenase E1 component
MSVLMNYKKSGLDLDTLLDLYAKMLKSRMIEEKMLILLRQGKISKWFSGIGQEAISSGVVAALEKDEYILPMHRNLGVFTGREIPLDRLFSQFQGKKNGFTNGRDRSFHFGTNDYSIVGMISHLGPQMAVADGIALGNKLKLNKKVCLVFSGEGGTSEGDFHEALNVASVWKLPVIFLIENNGYGLSTPTSEQYNCKNLSDRGVGYGVESKTINGNNVIEVFQNIKKIASEIKKKSKPFLLECNTFRMRGHEEASGTKYVPKELIDSWSKKDPLINFENFLLDEEIIDQDLINAKKKYITEEINNALNISFNEQSLQNDTSFELSSVFKNYEYNKTNHSENYEKIRFVDSISQALRQSLQKFDNLIFMGQDIAEYGGVFKISDGFLEEFGSERIRNTPICESAILSLALGLSISKYKSIIEMQFSDFVSSGFNPIINNLAKTHYRWGQSADVVVRMPCGAGVNAGPFHSQTNEAWFTHTPGLKVVYPAFPYDAKGLLISSIEDPNPIMFFEHKALYRTVSQEVPKDYYNIPLGKANVIHKGKDISIITYGMGVHWALDSLKDNSDISIEILDLRTLIPLDLESIKETVKKTGKVLILQESNNTGGFGSDISSFISQHLFEYLDAPIVKVASLDTPIPFANELEVNYLAKSRLSESIRKLFFY